MTKIEEARELLKQMTEDERLKSLKFGKPQSKLYHLNNINSFHSHLKKFMIKFNGVATKYLDYL